MTSRQRLHIDIHQEDGSMVRELPGVFATGDDLDELQASLEEGVSLVLAERGQEPRSVRLAPLISEPISAKVIAELSYV